MSKIIKELSSCFGELFLYRYIMRAIVVQTLKDIYGYYHLLIAGFFVYRYIMRAIIQTLNDINGY